MKKSAQTIYKNDQNNHSQIELLNMPFLAFATQMAHCPSFNPSISINPTRPCNFQPSSPTRKSNITPISFTLVNYFSLFKI